MKWEFSPPPFERMMEHRSKRFGWRKQGRCPRCGKVPEPGHKTCPICLAKNRKYLQRHRERIASPRKKLVAVVV